MRIMPFKSLFALCALFVPIATALAQVAPVSIPVASFGPLCNATGLCVTGGGGSLELANFLANVIVPSIRVIFVGVAVIYVASYAAEMILEGSEESVFTEKKRAFGYAAFGMGLAGFASFIAQAFLPSVVGSAIVAPAPIDTAVNIAADFVTILAGVFLVFLISYSGFRIIVLQGDEGEIDKQKKNFFNGLIGIAILFLARVGILAILPSGGPNTIISEIAGIIKFLLEIIATLSVVTLIASGVLLIVSMQSDALKQRGKRMFFSTLIILIIVIFSHALVSTFIGS